MQKSSIFGILEYPDPFLNCVLVHFQNPVKFTKIGKPCVTLEIQNPDILTFLEYWQLLKSYIYAEPSQSRKMECFAKIFKIYNYFSKAIYLTSLTRFWIRLSLNKYSLTWRVTSRHVLYESYSEPCHIQNPYIFRIRDIFRTSLLNYVP